MLSVELSQVCKLCCQSMHLMYPQSLPTRRGKLIPNSVLQCYPYSPPAYWGKTVSQHSLIVLNQWDQCTLESMMHDGYLKNYRPCWSAKSTLNVIKRTSNIQFYVIYALLMPFFIVKLPFWKQNSNYPVELLLLDIGNMSWYYIFQIKSRAKCQLDVDSLCSQNFFHVLGLIRGQQRVLLYFLHCTQGLGPLVQTEAICLSDFIVDVNAWVPLSDRGDWMWFMYFFFIVTSVFFVLFVFLWWNSLLLCVVTKCCALRLVFY